MKYDHYNFALRYYLYSEKDLSDPMFFVSAGDIYRELESTMGHSDVNLEIEQWAKRATIGDTWEEDDLVIVRF